MQGQTSFGMPKVVFLSDFQMLFVVTSLIWYIIITSLVLTDFLLVSLQVQFLKKAVDILCQCRQTLMYTYVFAYYLKKNNQSMIFEDNQKDLESATEKLSEYLERDITSENLNDIKQKVQDKYRCAVSFSLHLL